MSIMDIFRSAPVNKEPVTATPGAGPAPITQPNQQPGQQGGQAANQTNNTQTQQTSTVVDPNKVVAPLDKFADLWKVDPAAKKEEGFDPTKIFNLDPAKLSESVKTMNFMPQISAEVAQKLNAGGEEGVKATLALINEAGQNAFMQSMQINAKMVEGALTKAHAHNEKQVSETVRRQAAKSAILEANPALNSPAAAPILESLQKQLLEKNPMARPEEIRDQAVEFLAQFAEVARGKQVESPEVLRQKTTAKATDFSSFLE